jgi:hypothetical protein
MNVQFEAGATQECCFKYGEVDLWLWTKSMLLGMVMTVKYIDGHFKMGIDATTKKVIDMLKTDQFWIKG